MRQLTLNHLIEHASYFDSEQNALRDLQSRAIGENSIREAVQELIAWASRCEFHLITHQSGKPAAGSSEGAAAAPGAKPPVPLIKDWKDLTTKVGEQQSLLDSLRSSPYFPPFEAQMKEFGERLLRLDVCLTFLNAIQRKWVYLEPIFSRGALPQEQPRFHKVDEEFTKLMFKTRDNPNLMEFVARKELEAKLEGMQDQLDRCQRALNKFLEEKRSIFPRFYFIGDDDLLEILGQVSHLFQLVFSSFCCDSILLLFGFSF